MTKLGRLSEYIVAAALAMAAFVISPPGIELITGRAALSYRVTVISLVFVGFLLAVIVAVLARGRLRRVCFHVIAWIFPLAMLAAAELAALSVHLADRIAPLEDTALLANKAPWPTFTDASSWTPEGFVLCRPFGVDGITLRRARITHGDPDAEGAQANGASR